MRLRALQHIPSSFGEIVPGQEFQADDSVGQRIVDANKAERLPDPDLSAFENARGQWDDQTVVCIASGPSLTHEDCELVWQWQACGGGKVIAINSSFKRAIWADILYAGDRSWWRVNFGEADREFVSEVEFWTGDESAHLWLPRHIYYAPSLPGPSSGHDAVRLADHFGAARIILLGYDMMADNGRQQWHEPHPNAPASQPYGEWINAFNAMAEDLKERGITVVNCTRRTALKCFPRVALQDELALPVVAA